MPYTPALRSPPVKEVRVQVDEGGTKKAREEEEAKKGK